MRSEGLMKRVILCFVFAVFLSSSLAASDSAQEITQLLQQWPVDFNNKNLSAVCGLFASDLVASYPGSIDRNYEQMCQRFSTALSDPNKVYHYELPKIEQIIIQDTLAVVRLIWTLEVRDLHGQLLEKVEEKGLDIFRRQQDNSWKIAISYAYPLL